MKKTLVKQISVFLSYFMIFQGLIFAESQIAINYQIHEMKNDFPVKDGKISLSIINLTDGDLSNIDVKVVAPFELNLLKPIKIPSLNGGKSKKAKSNYVLAQPENIDVSLGCISFMVSYQNSLGEQASTTIVGNLKDPAKKENNKKEKKNEK